MRRRDWHHHFLIVSLKTAGWTHLAYVCKERIDSCMAITLNIIITQLLKKHKFYPKKNQPIHFKNFGNIQSSDHVFYRFNPK